MLEQRTGRTYVVEYCRFGFVIRVPNSIMWILKRVYIAKRREFSVYHVAGIVVMTTKNSLIVVS